MFASATLPRSAGSSIRSVLSSQSTQFKSTGNGLDDDKDPRDVSNNSFNRFDPKYISIGPKAVRGNNNLNVVAAATANKCATLRHVGRYGGSLKGASTSPNLRSAKTPSIATVSKDYCPQPDCVPQTYTTEVIVPQPPQPQTVPPPAPLPPPKPKTPNTFTEIPGTTGVGSSYAKEQQQLLQQQQLLLLHQQQQQQLQQQQQQLQQQQLTMLQQAQQHPTYHAHTTHILPPSAVYSIETSGYQQQTQQQQQQQQHQPQPQQIVVQSAPMPAVAEQIRAQPQAQPQPTQRSPNPVSIINQPLPEIPQSAQQSKIPPQPLSAANLHQYRSLQRPQVQKVQLPIVAAPNISHQQQQQHHHQQPQQQQPPLPPKNRHRTATRESQTTANIQTLPPKSTSLRQQQSTSYNYERDRERERDRDRERERERDRERERERERDRDRERERERFIERHEKTRRTDTLDNSHGIMSGGSCHYEGDMRREHSYDTSYSGQQQSYHQQQRYTTATTPNNNYYHSSSASKHQQQELQRQQQQQYIIDAQQQNAYYRSLKRGGSHVNSDLYSVTEL